MFVVNVTFCLVASVLLAFVVLEAECSAARGPLLADTEIATGRTFTWSVPVAAPTRTDLR